MNRSEILDLLENKLGLEKGSLFAQGTQGNMSIDTALFALIIHISRKELSIGNLRVQSEEQGRGYARKILSALHEYADKHNLEVRAYVVLAGYEPFWERMGYEMDGKKIATRVK